MLRLTHREVTVHQDTGQDKAILAQRKLCMGAATAANPSRWGKRVVMVSQSGQQPNIKPRKKPVKQAA